tara:strand:- start:192996 stop:193592 length:597 start_codon:yes stop_codon:yes gene_type:complete
MYFSTFFYHKKYYWFKDWKVYTMLAYSFITIILMMGLFKEVENAYEMSIFIMIVIIGSTSFISYRSKEALMGTIIGKLEFDEFGIKAGNEEYLYSEIEVLRFSAENVDGEEDSPIFRLKLTYKPNIKNGSGNHIVFKYEDKIVKYRFLLNSLKKKKEFYSAIGLLVKKGHLSSEVALKNLKFYSYEKAQKFKAKYYQE